MDSKLFPRLLFAGTLTTLVAWMPPTAAWLEGGTGQEQYRMGIGPGGHQSGHAATISSATFGIEGYGTYMQTIPAGKYLGKRLRMTGFMKTRDVVDWAGLCMRVDRVQGADRDTVILNAPSFDDMETRPAKGNTDWTQYEIVLDVPDDAALISFGALLSQTGQLWFDDLRLEVVDRSVPVTSLLLSDPEQTIRLDRKMYEAGKGREGPVNLDFEDPE